MIVARIYDMWESFLKEVSNFKLIKNKRQLNSFIAEKSLFEFFVDEIGPILPLFVLTIFLPKVLLRKLRNVFLDQTRN